MSNRTFFISVLILLLAYLSISLPEWKSLGEKKLELKHVVKLVAREKFIAERKSEVSKAYSNFREVLHKNESYFLSPATELSSDMNFVQSIIEKSFKENGVDVVRLTWEEQVEKEGYYKLPIRFSVRGLPNAVFSAFESVMNSGKLFRFERLRILSQRFKKHFIVVSATIVAYKLKKRVPEVQAKSVGSRVKRRGRFGNGKNL